MAAGDLPGEIALTIAISLRAYVKKRRKGVAHGDGVGYAIPELPSGRESFPPDASYYRGPRPANRMRFIEGPPTFAAEVRRENDDGAAAEAEMARKRADYFAAGTLVVWDVDPVAERVHVYRADNPAQTTTYRRGQSAEAEPAVPGWRLAVSEFFSDESCWQTESSLGGDCGPRPLGLAVGRRHAACRASSPESSTMGGNE
jgi:Uma2 family endonuclease